MAGGDERISQRWIDDVRCKLTRLQGAEIDGGLDLGSNHERTSHIGELDSSRNLRWIASCVHETKAQSRGQQSQQGIRANSGGDGELHRPMNQMIFF